MRTNVYIDGFNLYRRALKARPQFRWLNLLALSEILAGPKHTVHRIHYFTSPVKGAVMKEGQRDRQETYLRALATIPNLEVHFGSFQTHPKLMPRWDRLPQIKLVEVAKTVEKGSDVKLATRLVVDAFNGDFDSALVISNDSDLQAPIDAVKAEVGKNVGVVNPNPKEFRRLYGQFYKEVRPGMLARSQFPDEMQDENGTISRPERWVEKTPENG